MLHLLDKNRGNKYPLDGYNNYSVKHILRYGDKELRFSIPKNRPYVDLIEEETYILNPTQEFVVKEVNPNNNYVDVVAKLNIEELEGKWWETFESKETTITDCLNLAFAGTGYSIGVCNISKKRTIRKDICSTWDIIVQAIRTYRVEIKIDTINKVIDIYEQLGSDKGSFFMDSLNLKKLSVQSNSYDYCTKLIAIGGTVDKEDGTKERISCTVTNNSYSDKVIEQIWKDERYTIVDDLREDAQAKLDEISKPYRAYSANLYKVGECVVGDIITLISKENKIYDKFRIVTLTEYPDEKNIGKDEIEIANSILSFTDIQKEFEEASNTVDNITQDNGTISEWAISVKTFENIYARSVVADKIQGLEGNFGTLNATKANITELNAVSAKVQSLEANSATIVDLQAATARIGILEAGYGKISVLQSDVAEINALIAGNVTAGSQQTIVLNAQNTTIADALIKSAMIESLDVNKINAGTISTNKFSISSDNGAINISDSTMQFKDSNGNVRIQLGQAADGTFNFLVRGEDGKTALLTPDGITENAVADGLIKTDMMADKSVKGKNIDWDDFFTSINQDGTHTLNSSKVKLDSNNQTLDVAFNTLTTTVNNIDVGGANLLLNSSIEYYKESPDSGFTMLEYTNIGKTNGGQKQTYTLSIWLAKKDGMYQPFNSIVVGGGASDSWAKRVTVWNCESKQLGELWLYRATYTILPEWNEYDNDVIRFIFEKLDGQKVGCTIVKVKLEYGNKGTDWSPCYKDIDNKITTNSTAISVQQGKIDTLITSVNDIKTKDLVTLTTNYSNISQTVDNINSTVSTHKSSIGNLQKSVSDNISSINQIADKIDLKVATSTYNADLQGIREDIRSNSSSISLMKDKIALKVEATDINNAINNLNIGGENLVSNGNFTDANLDNPKGYWWWGGCRNWANYKIDGGIYIQNPSSGAGGLWTSVKLKANTTYTLSLACSKEANVKGASWIFEYSKSGNNIGKNQQINLNFDGIRHSYTFTTPSGFDYVGCGLRHEGSYYTDGGYLVMIRYLKIEEGNKATSFSISPNDLKNYTNTKVSSVEQQITASAITTKISQAINDGTSSINTTYFTQDNTGLTIKNGGIKVLNNSNTQIFGVDINTQQLLIRGELEQFNSNGRKSVEIKNNALRIYNYKSTNDDLVGGFANVNDFTNTSGDSGIALYGTQGHALSIGMKRDNTITKYITCVDNGDGDTDRRIDVQMETYFRGWGATFCNNDFTMRGFIKADAGAETGLCIIGANSVHLGYGSSSSNYAPGIDISSKGIVIWGNVTVAGTINGQRIGN